MTPEELEVRQLDIEEARIAADDNKSARSQAFKWSFTIASISAALGILALIKVPDNLPDLTSKPKRALAIVMFFAVSSAAVSIAFAATGSGGAGDGGADLRNSLAQSRKYIKDGLDVSRWAAVLAFAAISIAIGIIYLGTTEPPRYFLPQVDAATGQTTSTVCGVLTVNETTGAIELIPETDSDIAAVPVPDTTKLVKSDDGCH